MQLFSIITTLLLTFECVSAINEIRFIFNNAFPPNADSGCFLASEIALIDQAFGSQRRSLRSKDIESTTSGTRSLQTKAHCKDICAGIAAGSCWKKGCVGFRALEVEDENEEGRKLQLSCPVEIGQLHTKLDAVRNQVKTASCKNFLLREKRTASCYPDVVYGQIEAARVWNIISNTNQKVAATILPNGSTTICKSMKLNMEAMAQPCVQNVKLVLTGPNGYRLFKYEGMTPRALFGNNKFVFNNSTLPHAGAYTLTVSPDYINNTDVSKVRSFNIIVDGKC